MGVHKHESVKTNRKRKKTREKSTGNHRHYRKNAERDIYPRGETVRTKRGKKGIGARERHTGHLKTMMMSSY